MESHNLDLLLFVGRLLSIKSQQISHFISFIYLVAVTKLKPKFIAIEPVLPEKFDDLITQNSFNYDFFGDFHSCALLSINTLVALLASNKSWLKIKNSVSNLNSQPKKESANNGEKLLYKIAMPPVEVEEDRRAKNYYIQCLCVSNAPKDFVLYVTDVKLFNIVNYWNVDDSFCDLVNKVEVECDLEYEFPSVAKSAVVSGILTGIDTSPKDFEDILNDYFMSIRLLKVGEIICVNLLKSGDHLRSRPSLCNVSDVYFKVVSLRGQSNGQEYFVLKGSTDLYLNPPVHSYLPPIKFRFIKTQSFGFEISKCPEGLHNYFDKLKKIFKFLIKGSNIQGMILLSGVKGSGKKTTLKAVSAFFGFNFLQINCFDFYGANPSLTQGKLGQIFAKARTSIPCVVYLENVDLLGREQNYNENARMIDIFENQIKELWIRKPSFYPLIVVGSTQLKSSELIPSIARLFIHTISFDTLKLEETYKTLKWAVKSSNMICSAVELRKVAKKIRGYFYADVILLTQHAIQSLSENSDLSCGGKRILCLSHFSKGIEIMEAAYSDSIGAARVPTVLWEDVGGLEDLKEEIMLTLNLPIQHPELFTSGLKRSGILFYGPPGTGKTLMAKAVATECSYNFLSIKGPELMNMYVGQSEKNVREGFNFNIFNLMHKDMGAFYIGYLQHYREDDINYNIMEVFERAREASPCIIFFDELDSLAPSRGRSGDSGGVSDRVVSQLLAEMDGLDKNKDVFVIAATNRPDLIDQALLRPGRFDKMFYVGVCKDKKSKLSVLKALTRKFTLRSDVNFEKIIEALPIQVTGADLYSLCSNAWFAAARRVVHAVENGAELSLPLEVVSEDFTQATLQFVSSLTPQDLEYYENLKSTQTNYF